MAVDHPTCIKGEQGRRQAHDLTSKDRCVNVLLCGRPEHLAKGCRTRWESNTAPKPTSVASCKVREKSSNNCSLSMALINGLPGTKGFVGDTSVSVLRDTGCNGVIVKKDLISDEQFTGEEGTLKTVGLRKSKAPVAKVTIRKSSVSERDNARSNSRQY